MIFYLDFEAIIFHFSNSRDIFYIPAVLHCKMIRQSINHFRPQLLRFLQIIEIKEEKNIRSPSS